MKSACLTLALTALFWRYNHFRGTLNLMSYWYVVFGFVLSWIVEHYDYDGLIPDWFTGVFTVSVSLGTWLLLNYPAMFFLLLSALHIYSSGGIVEAADAISDILHEGDTPAEHTRRRVKRKKGQQGKPIALFMGDAAKDVTPLQSLREETESLTRLCTIKPTAQGVSNVVVENDLISSPYRPLPHTPQGVPSFPAPAPLVVPAAPALVAAAAAAAAAPRTPPLPETGNVIRAERAVLPVPVPVEEEDEEPSSAVTAVEEAAVVEEEEEEEDTDSPAPIPPPRTRSRATQFPTLPLANRKIAQDKLEYYDASDSASDSDNGEAVILSRRGVRELHRELHITRRLPRNDRFGMSRFAAAARAEAREENVASSSVARSIGSAVDREHSQGIKVKPESSSRPAKSPFPELPAAFADRFMQKSPSSISAISSETRNKFMRAETIAVGWRD